MANPTPQPPRAVRRPAPPPPAETQQLGTFDAVVDRIEAVLLAETEALSRGTPIDIAAITRKKRQGLLELSRLMRAAPTVPTETAKRRLAHLDAIIERNQATLAVQLQAVQQVADIVAGVLREHESDGTYSLRMGWQ